MHNVIGGFDTVTIRQIFLDCKLVVVPVKGWDPNPDRVVFFNKGANERYKEMEDFPEKLWKENVEVRSV